MRLDASRCVFTAPRLLQRCNTWHASNPRGVRCGPQWLSDDQG